MTAIWKILSYEIWLTAKAFKWKHFTFFYLFKMTSYLLKNLRRCELQFISLFDESLTISLKKDTWISHSVVGPKKNVLIRLKKLLIYPRYLTLALLQKVLCLLKHVTKYVFFFFNKGKSSRDWWYHYKI